MFRTLPFRLAALVAAAWTFAIPAPLHAQKALVYCPVGIDATGCNAIVAALTADATLFPGGVDAGYDGTSGTVDLAGADLTGYSVFLVPSLADGPDAQPYSLLRNSTIAGRLQAAFVGRAAVWSGTPDVGSTNRSSKDALIRNLATWARSDAGGTHGPGVVALQDNSDDMAGRYGWLGGISALSVATDTTFDVYSNVQVLTTAGQTILTSGGLQLAYTNMASYGLVAGAGGRNDATGARSSRVVLVTAAGGSAEAAIATVSTDKEDYTPGDTVTVTGAGWEPGETVSLLFHEDVDPPIHQDRTLTAVADAAGEILNREYVIDEQDDGIQFILTATGLTSGRTAQTTFTDGNKLQFNTAAFSVAFNVCSAMITVQMLQGNSPDNGAPTPVTLSSSSAGGAFYSNASCTTAVASVTIPTSGSTVSFFYKDANTGSPVITAAAGTGCSGSNCTVTQTETITGPDLTITKSHSGNFTAGIAASYTITVTNSGTAPTSGTVTVTDVQPAGLTFGSAAGTGWTCGGTTTISCTRTNALAAGSSYPAITLNVTPTTAGSVTNVATVAGGGEANAGNNSVSDPTTVLAPVDLTIDKSHSGNFSLGVNGAYTLTVSNGGGIATTGTITVTDVLPAGLGFVSAAGTGWTCGFASGTVTCTRTTAIGAGLSAPNISLTVSVAEAAFPSVTNTASVSGGGEPSANNTNNSDSDPTTVLAPDLTVNKSHTGNFNQGVTGTYSFTVTNGGGSATSGTVTVTDVLPSGLGFVSGGGGGWTCADASGTVTCSRPNAIGAGNSAPPFTIVVSVGAAAIPSVNNTATVSGGGEPAANNGNNSDSDPTTVGIGVDLTIDKSHTGNFTQGLNGTYSLTVSNPGTAVTSADVTVTDNLPTGLGFVSGTGTGWNACTALAQVVTCVRPAASTIAAGGAAPAITLTVSVAAAAIPSVTNNASVAGGGEPTANNGNNSDSDPTTVVAGVDLTIDKSHTGNFTEGVNGSYSLTVSNGGGTATSADVTVTDNLPTGLTFVSGAGTGWNACTALAQVVTCVRPAANIIAPGASAPAITLTVAVAAAAIPSVTNSVSVAGGGEPAANNGNNSDSDPTTVNPGNHPPLAVDDGPYTMDEDQTLTVTAAQGVLGNDTDADGDLPLTAVLVTGPAAGITSSFTLNSDGSFSFQPVANFNGSVSFTYKANDGKTNSVLAATVSITVNPVNDAPSFTKGADQTVLEDAGAQTVSAWASAFSAGPPDESGQTLTLTASNDNNALFSVQPSVDKTTGTLTYTPAADANGSATVTLELKDNGGTANGGVDTYTATFTITVTPVNDAPSFTKGGDKTVNEGDGAQSFSGWATNIKAGPANESSQTVGFTVTNDNNALFTVQPAVSATGTLTFTPAAGPNGSATVTVVIKDNGGTANGGVDTSAPQTFVVTVNNVAPSVSNALAAPNLIQVGGTVNASASFSDPGTGDTHTAMIAWGDGPASSASVSESSGSGTVSGSHIYASAGVYTVTVTVTDNDGGSGSAAYQYVVVYDPSAGFVTGGGWINSPVGAYIPDPTLTGKANFGFVSKYQKGANVPTGNTEFQFHAASLNFKSTVYDWLVVSGSSKASYKGSGTINGTGNYGFLLSAVDASAGDKFRIKIWDKGTGTVVYDNQMGAADDAVASTVIAGGSIVVQTNSSTASK